MSASTPAVATSAPKLSITDLPIGPGVGRIPVSDECHPKSWFQSPGIVGNGGVQPTAHGLGRVPGVFMAVPYAMGLVGVGGAQGTISAQTADATNVNVTATAAIVTYRIFAI